MHNYGQIAHELIISDDSLSLKYKHTDKGVYSKVRLSWFYFPNIGLYNLEGLDHYANYYFEFYVCGNGQVKLNDSLGDNYSLKSDKLQLRLTENATYVMNFDLDSLFPYSFAEESKMKDEDRETNLFANFCSERFFNILSASSTTYMDTLKNPHIMLSSLHASEEPDEQLEFAKEALHGKYLSLVFVRKETSKQLVGAYDDDIELRARRLIKFETREELFVSLDRVCDTTEFTDLSGDGCDWYEVNPEGCGLYDTIDFYANEDCCACIGEFISWS